MAGKFTIRKTDKGNFVFNLKASNGQVILTSQAYADKRGAMNGIESARKNSAKDANFERQRQRRHAAAADRHSQGHKAASCKRSH